MMKAADTRSGLGIAEGCKYAHYSIFDTPTAKARGILGLTTAPGTSVLHGDARYFNRLHRVFASQSSKRDFPCAPRYGVWSSRSLVFAATDRDSHATGFTRPALRGRNPLPVLSRTSGIIVPNGDFTTRLPPTSEDTNASGPGRMSSGHCHVRLRRTWGSPCSADEHAATPGGMSARPSHP